MYIYHGWLCPPGVIFGLWDQAIVGSRADTRNQLVVVLARGPVSIHRIKETHVACRQIFDVASERDRFAKEREKIIVYFQTQN